MISDNLLLGRPYGAFRAEARKRARSNALQVSRGALSKFVERHCWSLRDRRVERVARRIRAISVAGGVGIEPGTGLRNSSGRSSASRNSVAIPFEGTAFAVSYL